MNRIVYLVANGEDGNVREVAIAEVAMDDWKRVFIRPVDGDFEHVYRAATEVHWDRQTRCLFHPRPPQDWTPVQWFRQIIATVANEYGVTLTLTALTMWTAVSVDWRSGMEAAAL